MEEETQQTQPAPAFRPVSVHPTPIGPDGLCGVNIFVPRENPKYVAFIEAVETALRRIKLAEEAYLVSKAKLWAPDSGAFPVLPGSVDSAANPEVSDPVAEAVAPPTKGLPFSAAIELMRQGLKVKRARWTGRGNWLDAGSSWQVGAENVLATDWEVVEG